MTEQKHTVKIEADTTNAKRGAKQVEQSFTKSFFKAQIAVQAFNKALSIGADIVSSSIDNALEYERTSSKLAAALRNAGVEVQAGTRYFNDQSSALQKLTGVSDENIRSMQALALNMGVSTDRVDDFVKAAITLSNTTGQAAPEAMKQLVKTLSGLQGELGEALPQIKELTKEQLLSGQAIDVINTGLGENLTILTEGTAGGKVGLTNAWNDLTEQFGLFVTGIEKAFGVFNTLTGWLESATGFIERFDKAMERAADSAGALTGGGTIGNLLAFPIAATAAGAEAAFGGGGDMGVDPSTGVPFALMRPQGAPAGSGGGSAGGGAGSRGRGRGGRRTGGDAETGPMMGEWIDLERVNFEVEQERELQAQRNEALEAFTQQRIDTINSETAARERAMAEQYAAQKDHNEAVAQMQMRFVGIGLGILESWITGGKDAALRAAKGKMRGLGFELIADGIKNQLTGEGRAIASYGFDISGDALVAFSVAEIAAGVSLVAGSLPGHGSVGSGGGGGGRGRRSGGGSSGIGGSFGRNDNQGPQLPSTVNVHISGSMTNEETMLSVQRAMQKVNERRM